MAKYILRKTAIFIGDKYFPEESIFELSQREAEKINQSISAGILEKLPSDLTQEDIHINASSNNHIKKEKTK